MITPVMPNMFMPSIMENNSVASVLQTAVDNSSLISMTVSEGGFTTEGLAFLAWLALLKDEEKELTLAQRMLLLGVLLGSLGEGNIFNYESVASINNVELANSIPAIGYNQLGGAIAQSASIGALFSASMYFCLL